MEDDWIKTSFEQTRADLFAYGPTAPVGISEVGKRQATLQAVALIDTGAAGTGISPKLAAKLNLQPIGTGLIHEAGREPIAADIFEARLFFPGMDVELDIAGLPSLAEPHDMIVGRDVLAQARISVDFTTGITLLQFLKR